MTVLLTPAALEARLPVAQGALAPLAGSLRGDLARLLDAGTPWIPPEKARLTRTGGRCPTHGVLLDFDPWRPREHRCPECGERFRDDEHYRWWIMNYQLWLAERAVHAAALHVLTDDADCGALATAILRGYVARYDAYPNRDNVLGPTRPFFSTYLESIWLLQLAVALDLLEARAARTALGDELRARVIRPSVTLIASYDEGTSNRQAYNNAAMAAAGALLGDEALVARAILGPSGVAAQLTTALLEDGTWFEGENYHLFAHRGLWYGVTIADALGVPLPGEGRRRFGEAFATPFATALPDFTFPSRRDSQYRVSLRLWRIAESCELGVARGDDPRLLAALAELYDEAAPEGEGARATSTAEAERNVAPVRLSRASLGWKSLLFARERLPRLEGRVPESVHLAGQGIAIFRRNEARTYIALDYGESGGGHGHPDRLNLWLVAGDARVLEDVGTGSYVDPTLHWYRSTLAHNAPLAEGRSQWRTAGELTAWEERAGAGLVSARATIAPGVVVERTVVAMDRYLVDEVRWQAGRVITFDLPMHVDAESVGNHAWRAAALAGGRGQEDGFDFVSRAEHLPGNGPRMFAGRVAGVPVRVWSHADTPHEWWRCVAPGPPGEGARRFLCLRSRANKGCIRSVWSWTGDVDLVALATDVVTVQLAGGDHHEHRRHARAEGDGEWRVAMTADGSTGAIIFPMRAAPVGAPSVASSARDEERQSGWDGSPDDATLAPARHDVAGEALASGEGSGEPRHAAPILLRTSEGIPAELDAQATGAAPPPLGETRVAHFVLGREHYR
ncbi:MAG: heparinase II/III family protein, partial [Gemmatimonadota bacterium]